jgi:hypothetical protein
MSSCASDFLCWWGFWRLPKDNLFRICCIHTCHDRPVKWRLRVWELVDSPVTSQMTSSWNCSSLLHHPFSADHHFQVLVEEEINWNTLVGWEVHLDSDLSFPAPLPPLCWSWLLSKHSNPSRHVHCTGTTLMGASQNHFRCLLRPVYPPDYHTDLPGIGW